LARLWEIANLDPEMTRNSASAQIKALAMIVAIEGLIPDRRAVSSEKKSAPPPNGHEDSPGVSDPPPSVAAEAPSDLGPAPDPTLDPSEPNFVRPFSPTETTPSSPHARLPASAPDSIEKNPSTWRLRL
jgi:hypothetical protein